MSGVLPVRDGDVTHHLLTKEFAADPMNVRRSAHSCAVANLVRKELGCDNGIRISTWISDVHLFSLHTAATAELSRDLSYWIVDFDDGSPVDDIEFDLIWKVL